MLKKHWALLLIPMLAILAFAGCSSDDSTTPSTTLLTQAEEFDAVATAALGYLNDAAAPGVVSYAWMDGQGFDTFTILDVRGAADYAAGHIANAMNTSLGTVLADIAAGTIPVDKPFVVVCYTGQSAGHVVAGLRILGYEAYSYGWGMSGWHTDLDGPWEGNAGPVNGNAMADAGVAIETTVNTPTTEYAWPDLGLSVETDAEAVYARVEATLAAGFKGKSFADINADGLSNYFIVNYWTMDQYTGVDATTPGHIPGAYCFPPKDSMDMAKLLKYLPTDKPIIVYCWTGQNSSQVTFALNCLGYEAYSLKYGANNLFWSQLGGHQWSDSGPEYPLVTE